MPSRGRAGQAGSARRTRPAPSSAPSGIRHDIWLRREFELPDRKLEEIVCRLHHDEDVTVYVNGVKAVELAGYTTAYGEQPLTAEGSPRCGRATTCWPSTAIRPTAGSSSTSAWPN